MATLKPFFIGFAKILCLYIFSFLSTLVPNKLDKVHKSKIDKVRFLGIFFRIVQTLHFHNYNFYILLFKKIIALKSIVQKGNAY